MPTPAYRPAGWRRAAKPKATETDLKTLADAVNEAAKREAGQWFYFVTIMVTLAAIVGSTTHRILFLEDPVKVPLLSLELPLKGFYVAAPAIFLVLHFYVLAQLGQVADKLWAFLDAVAREAGEDAAARDLLLKRLDSFPIVQLLAAERFGTPRARAWLMAWTTLVGAPVLLLVFFQLRFLPYHDVGITWWHRVMVLADLVVIWWLWPTYVGQRRWRTWHRAAPRWGAAAVVLMFSWGVARFPALDGEEEGLLGVPRRVLFEGRMDPVRQQDTSLFSNRLVLPDEDFVPEEEAKLPTLARTRVLRGRDLRLAWLDRADLRKADFTGADLRNASLVGARLEHADFSGADLRAAHLTRAFAENANFGCVEDNRIGVVKRRDGCTLLQAASLSAIQAKGATFRRARLQAAWLDDASLPGADFSAASLQGAGFQNSDLRGASFFSAKMQAASLVSARLQGAFFHAAEMQGVRLSGARLQGAFVTLVHVWRANGTPLQLDDAVLGLLDESALPPCLLGRVPWETECARYRSWPEAVEQWIDGLPKTSKVRFRDTLAVLLRSEEPYDRWAAAAAAPGTPDFPRQAKLIGDLACDEELKPHVIRMIVRQFSSPWRLGRREIGEHAKPLLARLANPDACAATRSLTEVERGELRELATRSE